MSELLDDLVASLRDGPLTLEAGGYGAVLLVPLAELRVETLGLTPNLSPLARDDPHRYDGGSYAAPVVDLVQGEPRPGVDFPAWLFLWLPDQRRYGTFDLDHGDLILFAPEVRWSDIAAESEPFVLAGAGPGAHRIPAAVAPIPLRRAGRPRNFSRRVTR